MILLEHNHNNVLVLCYNMSLVKLKIQCLVLPVRICIMELVAVLHCSLNDDEEPETVKL